MVFKRSSIGVWEVLNVFQGFFMEVLRVFQGRLSGFPRNLSRRFKKVHEVSFLTFVVAWISSQLPEQKEGLLLFIKVLPKDVYIRWSNGNRPSCYVLFSSSCNT